MGLDKEPMPMFKQSLSEGDYADPDPPSDAMPDSRKYELTVKPKTSMQQRHPLSMRYHDILTELGKLHDRKQQDYGNLEDPFANLNASSQFGVEPWRATLVRMNDKWARIQSFAQRGDLENESVIDSLMDIAVYSVICIVLMEESNERN